MNRFQIACLVFLLNPFTISGQSVIINEMSQGSDGGKEWVELLVIDEGVDIRGWEIGDNDDGDWHPIAEFTDHENLNNLASGTIVVIYNSGDIDETIIEAGGEDISFDDKSVILGVNNSSFIVDTGPWGGSAGAFANTDRDDAATIRNASDIIIHDMAVTHTTPTVPSPGSAKVKYYTGNTVAGVFEDSNWAVASSSTATPGVANGGDNSNWVDQSLPVELSAWKAFSSRGQVNLQWTTDSEIENQGFTIERCKGQTASDREWTKIASFVSNPELLGQGSSSAHSEYAFIDKQVNVGETYTYHLSDVDYRGNVTQHHEISVTVNDKGNEQEFAITTYPNPSNSGIHIVLKHGQGTKFLQVDILNLRGELVKNIFSGKPRTTEMDVLWNGKDLNEISVPSGIYIVNMADSNVSNSQVFTIIQ